MLRPNPPLLPKKGINSDKKKKKRRENKWAQGEHGLSQTKAKVLSQKGKRHLLLGGLQDCQKTCTKYILQTEAKKTQADEWPRARADWGLLNTKPGWGKCLPRSRQCLQLCSLTNTGPKILKFFLVATRSFVCLITVSHSRQESLSEASACLRFVPNCLREYWHVKVT